MLQHSALHREPGIITVAPQQSLPDTPSMAGLLGRNRLHSVFQPIVSLEDGSVFAHEALIRGPVDTPLHRPDVMLRAAREENLRIEFETEALNTALSSWRTLGQSSRLFVNVSADVLLLGVERHGLDGLSRMISETFTHPRRLVFEITEHEHVSDVAELADAAAHLRELGVMFALDDFGDGHSSLRLWSQLKPDIVKIDKFFIRDISTHAVNLQTVRALIQIAHVFDSELVAEGIENAADLRVLRDLGIRYGQGYFLGRPERAPVETLLPQAVETMRDRRIAVLPELKRSPALGRSRPLQVIKAPTATPVTNNHELLQIFIDHPELHAVAIVDEERPIGLINRHKYMTEAARPFFKEIFGREACLTHANQSPRLVDLEEDVEELLEILTSADQRYLTEGFIITQDGRYLGLGTGEHLVRSVTEMRIEAARHANPLTFLPGNIPLTQHIERLLQRGGDFVACYCDLNNFKPFNDQYGYWRGDEMIRLLARTCIAECDPGNDFIGHVGGDDFVLLMQSLDWEARSRRIIEQFDRHAIELFDERARLEGGIHCEDRHGVQRFFPFTTLAIGAVMVGPGQFHSADDVANEAAQAKHQAKMGAVGLCVRQATEAAADAR